MPWSHQIETCFMHPSLPPSIIVPSALGMGALPLSVGVPLPETKRRPPQGFSQTPRPGDALRTPSPDCICASLAGAWHAPPPSPHRLAVRGACPAANCVTHSTATPHWARHPVHLHGARGAWVWRPLTCPSPSLSPLFNWVLVILYSSS